MNFSFYVYGTPGGYNQYPSDNNSVVFQEFADKNTTESQLTVYRKGALIYYAYVRKLQEKSSLYIGFCLVFNGIYSQNPQKLFSLFDRAFDDVLTKGELLRFERGKCIYTVNKFVEKQIETDRIKGFFKDYLERDFNRDFTAISPSFKVGAGSQTISVRETGEKILAAVAEFDCLHIANSEKSLSELEKTHKMLTALYVEKQELYQNYKKLLGQKKQYKVVLFLCFAVIVCAVGLFVFNKNLQSKDSQIVNLNSELKQKKANIENLNTNVAQLQTERDNLAKEKSNLMNQIKKIKSENQILSSENQKLNHTINEKSSNISNLERQNLSCKNENSNLSQKNSSLNSEISDLKAKVPILYKTISKTDFYYKFRCDEEYKKTNCSTLVDFSLKIYKTDGNYGLSEYGWILMSNLQKD